MALDRARFDAPARPVTIEGELAALEDARAAAAVKLARLQTMPLSMGADELSNEYITAVVQGGIEQLQRDLVVFGRLDDSETWRIGLYGVDRGGEQLVVDWRARLAEAFYQATASEPLGFDRRVTYLGAIDELFIEELTTGEITGHSPLLTELARARGEQMRAAVATLQAEQDRLVRLEPTARLVLRGGPGTGKTVVALHRAAWLAYNDRRPTAGRILALGPSERYLRFVATVLPTLGEVRIRQTTLDRLLGPSGAAANDPRWLAVLDELERSVVQPQAVRVGRLRLDADEVAEMAARFVALQLPWRDRRRTFVQSLAARAEVGNAEVAAAVKAVWKPLTTRAAWTKLRNRRSLVALGAPADLIDDWLRTEEHGVLADEVRSRCEGVATRYGHVIVDEGQDLSELGLRAVLRRGEGFTFVGDDAQRSAPHGIGLRAVAAEVGATSAELATAYRMSAEIAEWLNAHAHRHAIDAVELIGVRPTGRPVLEGATVAEREAALRDRWSTVAVLGAGDVWSHKGVEYDAVVVDRRAMTPAEVYLAASRAAHELAVV
ncbi:MAG: AAA family ATPase [Acidimicrobiia bacterium]